MPDNDNQILLAGNDLAKAVKSAIAKELKIADNMDAPGGTAAADWELVSSNKLDEKKLIAIYTEVSGIPELFMGWRSFSRSTVLSKVPWNFPGRPLGL